MKKIGGYNDYKLHDNVTWSWIISGIKETQVKCHHVMMLNVNNYSTHGLLMLSFSEIL